MSGMTCRLLPPVVDGLALEFPDHCRPLHVLRGAAALAEDLLADIDGVVLHLLARRLQFLTQAQHVDLVLAGRFHAVHPEEGLTDGLTDR